MVEYGQGNTANVRRWRAKNRDKWNAYQREWREKNRDKSREYGQKYREANREKIAARQRIRRVAERAQRTTGGGL